jgi:hypothetical protein
MQIKIQSVGRACEGCTKCCEGWLSGEAYGQSFGPSKKCVFLKSGCSIYPNHPDDPCKIFECQWKSNRAFPAWLKPDKSGVIILKKYIDIFDYLMVVPAGSKIKQEVFDWAKTFSSQNIKNHVIIMDGKNYHIYTGHREFKKLAENKWLKGG